MISTGKIFINGRFLTQKMTGVNRFAYEMCRALSSGGLKFEVVSPGKILKDYQPDFPVISWGTLSGPLWEIFDLPRFLSKHGKPLLISLSGLGPLFYNNQVITIHDLAFMANPGWYSRKYYWFYKLCTPVIARHARKIITVSNFSKGEIHNLLGIPQEKIVVINNAVKFNITDNFQPENSIKGKYVLSVSSLDPRKNTGRLIEAYKTIGLTEEYKLVLVGKSDKVFNMPLSEEIAVRSLGYVSDRQLVQLYKNASLFIYPSLYEGFGIPPMEAMSLGCPAVISDIPVFREVFQDAGCYVDPYNISSIREGIVKVLKDTGYRNMLIDRGYECAGKYSWARSAGALTELINTL